MCVCVCEASSPVFLTPAISSSGNANVCFDSWTEAKELVFLRNPRLARRAASLLALTYEGAELKRDRRASALPVALAHLVSSPSDFC